MEKILVDREFIPTEIVRGWSDDGENINYIDLDESEEEIECAVDGLFFESLLLDCDPPENEKEGGFFSSMIDSIKRLKEGDINTFKDEKEELAILVASQYYLYPFSPGGIEIFRKRNSDKIKKAESQEVLREMAVSEYERTRLLSERFQAEYISIVTGTYFWDLKPTLLYAPETSSFALGESPFVMMNFFFTDAKSFYPFAHHGVVLILPIAPKMALCFYDPIIYRVKKKAGRAVLSDEDVDVINTHIAEYSARMLFSLNEKNDSGYIRGLLEDETKIKRVGNYHISIFQILASSVDITVGALREYPETMMLYDLEHNLDEDEYLEMRTDHAFALLDELRSEGVLG